MMRTARSSSLWGRRFFFALYMMYFITVASIPFQYDNEPYEQIITDVVIPTMPREEIVSRTPSQPWCLEHPAVGASPETPHFLVAIIYVRIREDDLPELSRLDLLHWIAYMRYAGVDHVYVYDCRADDSEDISEALRPAVVSGFVTHIDWHDRVTKFIADGFPQIKHKDVIQKPAKQDCWKQYGETFTWALLMDMDEYPYSEDDTQPGFLSRFLYKAPTEVSAYELSNYVMQGLRNYSRGDMLLEQVPFVTVKPWKLLNKVIIRSDRAKTFLFIHHPQVRGRIVIAPASRMRMNHVWGGRFILQAEAQWTKQIPASVLSRVVPIDLAPLTTKILECSFNMTGTRRAYDRRIP